MANRVAEVNKALRARGVPHILTAGRGYYYFRGGNALCWYSSSVYVYRAVELTLERWLEEYDQLANDAKARGCY